MKLLITRPAADATALAKLLEADGHEVLIDPLLDIRHRDKAALDLDKVAALLFTSANGVRAFAQTSQRRDLPCYAVGDHTARTAIEVGFTKTESAEGDVLALTRLVRARARPEDGVLLHVSGTVTAGDLAAELTQAGFTVRTSALYEAEPSAELSRETRLAIISGELDGVLLFSPRTARHFAALVRVSLLAEFMETVEAWCLSPAVAAALDGLVLGRINVAAAPTQDALLKAIRQRGGGAKQAQKRVTARPPVGYNRGQNVEHAVEADADPEMKAPEPPASRPAAPSPLASDTPPEVPPSPGTPNPAPGLSSPGPRPGAPPAQPYTRRASDRNGHNRNGGGGNSGGRRSLLIGVVVILIAGVGTVKYWLPLIMPELPGGATLGLHGAATTPGSQTPNAETPPQEFSTPDIPPVAPPPANEVPPTGPVTGDQTPAPPFVAGATTAAPPAPAPPAAPQTAETPAAPQPVPAPALAPTAPVGTDLGALQQAIGTLRAEAAAKVNELQQNLAQVSQRLTALTSQPTSDPNQLRTMAAQIAQLSDRLTQDEARIDQRDAVVHNERTLVLAAGQVRAAIAMSAPFDAPLAVIRAVAPTDATLTDALAVLDRTAKTGVPSRMALAQQLDLLGPKLSQPVAPPADAGLWQWIKNRILRLVSLRRVDDGAGIDAMPAGPDRDYALAKQAMRGDDLATAVKAMRDLQGDPAVTARPWLDAAASRLDAEQAADALLATLTKRLASGEAAPAVYAAPPPQPASEPAAPAAPTASAPAAPAPSDDTSNGTNP